MAYANYSLELTLFERFVQITDSYWWVLERNPQIGFGFYLAVVLMNWATFRYHYAAMYERQFVLSNLEIAGRFSKPTYDMWKWLSVTFVPFGAAVVFFSLFTGLRTQPFLAVFGIKGAGQVKKNIMIRALHQHTWISRLKQLKKPPAQESDYQSTFSG